MAYTTPAEQEIQQQQDKIFERFIIGGTIAVSTLCSLLTLKSKNPIVVGNRGGFIFLSIFLGGCVGLMAGGGLGILYINNMK